MNTLNRQTSQENINQLKEINRHLYSSDFTKAELKRKFESGNNAIHFYMVGNGDIRVSEDEILVFPIVYTMYKEQWHSFFKKQDAWQIKNNIEKTAIDLRKGNIEESRKHIWHK